jgi:hypothetical protein
MAREVSQDMKHDHWLGGPLWTAAVAGLGLLVAVAGAGITQDECDVACGTAGDQAFREAMGYVGLFLGIFSIALALRGRRGVATAVASVGGIACLAAFFEGLSHLS